ncbi:uncharacterized protein LOC128215536 [Mya arenaria]|uniref:uncharacterized protein LOC128215536 n=1 Tax=Mya arenaria TaxID=6604 RepID=UPI0022DF5CB9|nr:uncharacterized protein LOC128215536 [Mya arenaria]
MGLLLSGVGILALLTSVSGQLQTRMVNRKVGPVMCNKNSADGTLTMTFASLLMDDDIQEVIGCDLETLADGTVASSCDTYELCEHEPFTAMDDQGVQQRYIRFTTTVDLTDTSRSAATNPCGYRQNIFEWMIGYRHDKQLLHGVDTNYILACDADAVQDRKLTKVIVVTHNDLLETLTVNNPVVTMHVLKHVGGDNYQETTSCIVGEDMKLEIRMDIPGVYSDFVVPWGLYSYLLTISPGDPFTSPILSLTDANGCDLDDNVLDLTYGFERQPQSTTQMAYYRTGTFTCRRFARVNSNTLLFSNVINYCFGMYEDDQLCHDSCATSTARKRRDVTANDTDLNDVKVYASLTIEDVEKEDENDVEQDIEKEEQEGPITQTTIIVVAVVGGVVIAALLLATVLVCCLYHRRSSVHAGSDIDSRASSTRKLPLY